MRCRSGLVAVLGMVVVLPGGARTFGESSGAPLDKEGHRLIAEALANGHDTVSLLVATADGQTPAVVTRLEAMGVTIAYRDDDVGYLRVVAATNGAAKVATIDGIVATEVDRPLDVGDPEPPEPNLGPAAVAPGPATPPVNPYLPVADVGAPQFIAAHPTFDGRGVTVGILDDGVDVLTPELQKAKLADGTAVPKIVDFTTTNDPANPFRPDPTWIDMSLQVAGKGNAITVDGQSYAVPANLKYRFGLLDERGLLAFEGDVNRDGNPPGSSGLFAVLWDDRTNAVRVDIDQDHSFSDEQPMTDYRVNRDVGVFGHDDPSTAVRDSVPFVIQTDGPRKLVNINVADGEHGTAVASVAVGNSFFGGSINGAAPNARLAVVRCNFFLSCVLEGVLHLVKRDHVDLVSLSFGPAFPPARNSSRTVYGEVFERVIERFDTQIFAAAGNSGPTLESVGSPSTTPLVVSVGGSARADTWSALFGVGGFPAEAVVPFSSRGLADDGALKPDIVAPAVSLAAVPAWAPPSPPFGGYQLPAGYAPVGGTSFAAPMAAGGAALLINAARQSGLTSRADQLRQSIFSSARRLPAGGVEDQGRGVMDVAAAWDVLRLRPTPIVIDVAAPVRTITSRFLPQPNTGPGLYEREGWSAGDTGQRTITLTRQAGSGKPTTFDVSWIGNDGTFSAPASIVLPRRSPTSLTINIAPTSPGLHSAILDLDDPTTHGVDAQLAVAIIAAVEFDRAAPFTAIAQGSFTASFEQQRFFFRMPDADVRAVKLHVADAPFGRIVISPASSFGVPATPPTGYLEGQSRPVVEWPRTGPGVWELVLQGDVGPYRLELNALGRATVDPTPVAFDPAAVGLAQTASIALTPTIGFTGSAIGTDLGPLHTEHLTLVEGEPLLYEIQVSAGTSSLVARVDHSSSEADDIDLYLYDCTGTYDPFCILADQGVSPTATEQVMANAPVEGTWVVVVDPFDLAAATTDADYADVLTDPVWGTIAVDDPPAIHPAGEAWTATLSATPLVAPPGGQLGGFINTQSDGILLWGGAQVELRNVT